MASLRDRLLEQARKQDIQAGVADPNRFAPPAPVLQDNPTPFTADYSPTPAPAPVQTPTEYKVSRDGFAMDEELGAKYGSYENYLSNVVTTQYKQNLESQAQPVKFKYKDLNTDAVQTQIANSKAANAELKSENFRSEDVEAAQMGMTVAEYRDFQRRKYELDEKARAAEVSAAPVTAARDSRDKIQDELNYLSKANYGAGNIDLSATPRFENGDGTYTYYGGMVYNDPATGYALLIPTSAKIDGQWMHLDQAQAIEQYRRTGRYLGAFKTATEAMAYSNQLHEQQEQLFNRRAELSAQYKTNDDLYQQLYTKFQTDTLDPLTAETDRFTEQYDPVSYYKDKGTSYSEILSVIEGLDEILKTVPAGSSEYVSAQRRRDLLNYNKFKFATMDELMNIYGTKATDEEKKAIDARLAELVRMGVDPMSDPEYQALTTKASSDRVAAANEIANRDALHTVQVLDNAGPTKAGKLVEALSTYAQTGKLPDDLAQTIKAATGKSNLGTLGDLYNLTKKELEKAGFSPREAKNTVEVLQRQGNAERNEIRMKYIKDFATYNVVTGTAATAASFLTNLLSPVGVVGGVVEGFKTLTNLTNGPTLQSADPNSGWFLPTNATNAVRSGITEAVNGPTFNIGSHKVDVFDTAYGILTSGIDSMIASNLPGKLGGFMLGASAAAQTLQEEAERGTPIGEALLTATAAGVFEGLFEDWSIGNFRALKETKAITYGEVLKNVGKSFITNMEEEAATELANVVFDVLRNSQYSNFNRDIAELMTTINPKTGKVYTKQEAQNKVIGNLAYQVGEAGVTGGLQGVLMGGVASAASIRGIHTLNQLYKLDRQQKGLFANLVIGSQFKQGSETRAWSDEYLPRIKSLIDSNASAAEKKSELVSLLAEIQSKSGDIINTMNRERVRYGPTGFTEPMHRAVVEGVENDKPATLHVETPTETRIREAQTAAGMSQETIDATKALLFDIASGKDADDIRFKGVDKNVLTGMPFRGVVENITGSKVFGRTAAEVRQSLTDIAHRINAQSIDINKTDVEETPQEDLVPPTETPMEEQAEAQPETQPESPANWYNTDAQAATEAAKREPRTTPSNIPLDNLIRNDWYSEKPSGNNLPKSDWYAGQAQAEGPTQATTPNGLNLNDLTRQSWYGDQATTEAQAQPEAPAQTESQTEEPAQEKSAAAANTQQAGTGEDEKKSKPKKEKSKARKIVDRILHGAEANTEANTEADDEPSLEVVGRTETNAETGSPAAAEVTVDIGGEQVTEAEFVADSIRGGKITEAQAREAFRRLANNESIPDDVRESIADIHEEGRVERGAAEQGITESQYLTQEVLNILLADKNITVKFVPGDEMPGQNGRMDHETGTLYINANADEADTRGLSGIAWVLGHEIFHAGDQAYRDSHPEETAKIKSLTDSVLGYTKDGEFVPGVMQRLASVGAIGGKYASMANNAEELQQQVDELKARYKEFLLRPGREQAYIDKHLTDADKSDPTKLQERIEALRAEYQQLINDTVTDDYIREEIAGDFVGTLLGFNAFKPGAKLKRIDLLRTLAGIDAEPLKAAQLSLRDRLQEKRISGLRGKAFREAFDTMQRESHDLMNDITTALDSYEPGKVNGVRESISSLAFSMGIDAERDPDTHKISYKIGGQSVDHVTKDHVKNHSGVGVMIRVAEENGNIKPEEANRQYQAMADLMNNIMKTQDPELYWNWAGATIFSAIRSNSDPQYSSTVDFSTVCRKTQDMLTAVSAAMMERAKQNPDGYGGLTKDEITNLQAKVNEANLPVPCPVCYVFSRWAGAGGILDNINRLQRKFGSMSQEEMTAQRNNLEQQMIDRGLAKKTKKGDYQFSRDNIDALVKEKAATVDKLEGEQAKLESLARLGQDTEESRNRLEAIAADLQQLKSDLDLLGEWQWVKNVATNPEYKPVPDYVLYNLDDGETFARDYNVVWGWRTTRGSGAGKAILPYSDMRLGDFFVGAKKGSSADESGSDTDAVLLDNRNAFTSAATGQDRLNADQKKLMASALKRVAAQNLIGGQRLQSTSDFRYEYALDYLQTFLEMQALGSKAQTYTKVREFVDIICSVGGDCNMSVMPKGKGYDNNKLVFSNVTGMDIKAALDANRRFDNAQLILVGINDTHIELALEDSEETGGIDIGFVIPYHTSGASIEGFISELVQNLGERINTKRDYWDYTKLQSDSIIKEQRLGADGKLHWEDARTDAQIALTALRKHLLTERDGNRKWKPTAAERQEIYDALARGNKDILGRSFDDLRETELKALAGDPKAIAEYKSWTQANVAKLYQRLWESDGQDYGTRLNSAQAEHIMPYEYWDTRTTRENAYINGFLFRSYCYNLGLRPRFTGWSSDGGRMTKTFTDDDGAETTQEYGDFSNSTGYWKTLIDRPMYDNNGNYREQQAINLTDFNQDMLNKEYAQNFPETYRARENDFEKATQVGRAWSENNQWREGVGTKEALEGMSEERKRTEAPEVLRRMQGQQSDEQRKTRYSLALSTNNQGQRLSRGQEEYFKDSKVRDDNGNLLVMYHGTNTPGFTVFDPSYSDDKRSLFFTSNPMMANSYTRAQNWGKNVDPYNMITEDSSAEDFNKAAEKIDSPYRVAQITREWLDDRRQWYKQLTDEILPYGKELYQIAQNLYGDSADGRNKAVLTSMNLLSKGQIDKQVLSDVRSLLFDSNTYWGGKQSAESKKAQKRLQKLEPTLRGLVDDAKRVVIAADIPDSEIGKYVWDAMGPNDSYAYEIGTRKSGFSGGALTGDLKTVMRSALDRVNMLADRSFGNRYATYVNLTNPFVLDAGTHITGPHNIEVDMNSECNIRVKVLEEDEYGYDDVVFRQTFENTDEGLQQLKEFIGDKAFNNLLEFSEKSKQKERKLNSDLSDEEFEEYIREFYPEVQSPIYIQPNDYFGEYVNIDAVQPGKWNDLTLNGQGGNTTREVAEWAQNNGYDGVLFKNIKDTGGFAAGDPGPGTIAIAFSPEQVKSTDNLDPTNDPDIRYSLSQNNGNGKYTSREQQIQDIVTRMMNANPDNHTLWNDSALSTERMPISKSQINNDSGFRQDRDAVNFPRKSENKKVAMRATQTIANSGLTDARAARMIEEATKDGVWSYIPESNDSATDWAKQEISDKDWGGAYGNYLDSVNKGLSSKKLTALGIQLYNDAIKREDYYAAMDVASLIIRNAHEAGAALQAMNMLGKLNADGKLYMMMKGINNITDYYKKLYPKAKIRIDDALVKAYQKAVQSGDKAAINAAQAAIEKTVASQIPATWKDRINNWRYFSMLANPTTHLRNVFGNLFFAPVRLMKQATKAGLERVFMGKTGADSNRTTALLNLTSKEDRDRFTVALKDASNVMDLIQSGGKQTGPKDRIENLRQIALTKALDKVMKGNTRFLDKEDVLFSSPAYAEALASFMKARGISAADYANGKISEELKTAAQKHAIKEAQKATYRDHNAFSDAIANIGQRGRSKQAGPGDKVLTTATEAILPFKRTPANIMARAWEYSPAELVTIAFSDIGKLTKAGTALREAQEESDGSLDARRRIQQAEEALADVKSNMFDHIASASVGSVVLMLGMLFRHRGWVIGSDDDDEEQAKFDKLVGGQEYALRDEAGNTYTIDWLAPEILPFFAGVAMYDKLIDRKKGEGGILGDIKNVAMSLYEPMLNMSMLSSLNDMLANQKYVEDNEQVSYLAKRVAASFVSQFFPTVFGKIENITEDKKYTTYINKQSPLGKDEQYNLASIMNKLPREYNQIINYDAWGREQSTGNIARRIAQNLLSPGYYKANASTPYDEELQRLKDLGYDKVLPTKVSQSQKVNEEYMTAEEYELFTKTMGQEQYKLIGQLLESSGYKRLSDKDKADAVRDMYKDAKQAAENAVLRMRGGESRSKIKQTSAEKAGLSPTTYVVAYSVYDNATTPSGYNATDSGNTPTWAKMLAVINNSSISNADKLKFVNGKSGRDEEFKTLDEAKAHYEKSKEKAKK
jgi:uncharacterized protein YbjQ (UPF0145 family)